MHWMAVAWLAGLAPWMAASIYLLAGRRRAVVPFLGLWGAGATATLAGPPRRRPPGWLVLAVVAALLGVLAAGRPVRMATGLAGAVVVLDRGVTMAGPAGLPFRGAVGRAAALLDGGGARLVCVPAAGAVGPDDDWAAVAAAVPPTGLDTRTAVAAAVADLLRTGGGPVLVLTDARLATADGRVVRVGPGGPRAAAGIVAVAARDRPRAAVMVRLVNRAGSRAVEVRVGSGGDTMVRREAMAAGGTADVFVDLPKLGPTVEVEVDPDGVDGRGYLVREGGTPTVAVTPGVPEAVRRMATVFNRGAGPGPTVVVSDEPLAGRAGVWVNDAGRRGAVDEGPTAVAAHPVTAGVTAWAGGGATPPAGFTAVVRRGAGAVVAVRAGPPRQVWADLDVGRAGRTADWVIFLANAFRWAGGDAGRFAAVTPRRLGPGWTRVADGPAPAGVEVGWWPGIYRSIDGRTVAVNAAAVAGGSDADRGGTPAARPSTATGERPVGGALAATAVACLAAAAVAWPRGGVNAGSQLT